MKKVLTLTAVLIAGFVGAWEQTLDTNTVLIVPQVRSVGTYADRQAGEIVTNGHYRRIGNTLVQAQCTGTTDGTMETNSIVSTDTATLIVSGSLTPDATGTYCPSQQIGNQGNRLLHTLCRYSVCHCVT